MIRSMTVGAFCLVLCAGGCVSLPGMPGLPPMPSEQLNTRPIEDMQARMNAAANPALPPVASLSCDQMQAELIAAGAKMSGQLDPSMAANAQEIQKAMQAQKQMSQAEVDRHQATVNQSIASLSQATQGIDLQRVGALNAEFTAKKCKTPQ